MYFSPGSFFFACAEPRMTLEHGPESLKQRKTWQFLAEQTANVGKQTHEPPKKITHTPYWVKQMQQLKAQGGVECWLLFWMVFQTQPQEICWLCKHLCLQTYRQSWPSSDKGPGTSDALATVAFIKVCCMYWVSHGFIAPAGSFHYKKCAKMIPKLVSAGWQGGFEEKLSVSGLRDSPGLLLKAAIPQWDQGHSGSLHQ